MWVKGLLQHTGEFLPARWVWCGLRGCCSTRGSSSWPGGCGLVGCGCEVGSCCSVQGGAILLARWVWVCVCVYVWAEGLLQRTAGSPLARWVWVRYDARGLGGEWGAKIGRPGAAAAHGGVMLASMCPRPRTRALTRPLLPPPDTRRWWRTCFATRTARRSRSAGPSSTCCRGWRRSAPSASRRVGGG